MSGAGVGRSAALQVRAKVIGLAANMVSHLSATARTASSALKWSVTSALGAAGIAANRDRGWTLISGATLLVRELLVWVLAVRVRRPRRPPACGRRSCCRQVSEKGT